MSVTMMDNSGPSTPVDVRTECEDLRAQLAGARATVLTLVVDLIKSWPSYDEGEIEPNDEKSPYLAVLNVFDYTDEEMKAEYQRQYDEWAQGSSDGQ